MEVDEIQRQVSKFQKVSSNGSSTTTTDNNSSNPQKLATKIGNFELHDNNNNHVDDHGGGGGGGSVARLYGWPSSRIVRVSRASGGKDRHSKVLTSKGLRDRRVRLSVGTAIQFYDLQDRLGYDQPSKAVEWLLKAAASSIDELPSLDLPIGGHYHQIISPKKIMGNGNEVEVVNNRNHNRNHPHENKNNNGVDDGNDNNNGSQAKSPACSSTSETSKGSDLSLSRAENRIKARERARDLASKKEKEKEIDSTRVNMLMNQVNNNISADNSSFTDLLTGGINTTTAVRSPIEYFFNRSQQTPPQLFQLPQFNITTTGETNHNNNLQHFSFFQQQQQQDNINNNFSMTSPSSSSVAPGGYTRGTLQSNLQSSILPHHYHHHLQRFQQSAMDGSAAATATNLPIFIVPNSGSIDHFPTMGGYHFGYGGVGDHQKDKGKN